MDQNPPQQVPQIPSIPQQPVSSNITPVLPQGINNLTKRINSKIISLVLIMAALLIGVIAFFWYQGYLSDQIREKLSVSQSAFRDYRLAMAKMGNSLQAIKDDANPNYSLESEKTKEQSLLNDVEEKQKILRKSLKEQKNISELKKYNSLIEKYTTASQPLIDIQKDILIYADALIQLGVERRDYETIRQDLSYGYSSGQYDRYLRGMDKLISIEDRSVKALENANVKNQLIKDQIESYIEWYSIEKKYLEDLLSAYYAKSDVVIGEAGAKFKSSQDKVRVKMKKETVEYDDYMKQKISALDKIEERVNTEASRLRDEYVN